METVDPCRQVEAAAFGILPDTGADSTAKLQGLLNANRENAELVLLPGRYDFYPESPQKRAFSMSNSDENGERPISLLLEDMHRVTVAGRGAELVFHGQLTPLALHHCREITIQGVSIDFAIPLSAEGTVVHACETYADLAIDPGLFPHRVSQGRLLFQGENWEEPVWQAGHMEFEPEHGTVAFERGDRFPVTRQEQLSHGLVRFWGDFSGRMPGVGNVVVLRHSRRLHCGIFVNECEDVVLEDVSLHATGRLGILCQFSENLRFTRVAIEPNRERGRKFVCGHDDGIHLSNDRGQVIIEDCRFLGLMDDPVNLHGTAARIEAVENGNVILGRFVHPQSQGFPHWAAGGQEIAFVRSDTLERVGLGIVRDYRLLNRETFALTLEKEVPGGVKPGDAMENNSNTPSLICLRNHFGGCRARGLLVCTPKPVRIEENRFDSSGAAILIAGDAGDWYECGGCQDVTIRKNTFSDACLTSEYEGGDAVISVHPNLTRPLREAPYHRNLRMEENVFYTAGDPVFYAKAASGIVFRGNRILFSCRHPSRKKGDSLFVFDHCTEITLEGNQIDLPEKKITLTGMRAGDIHQDNGMPVEMGTRKENTV